MAAFWGKDEKSAVCKSFPGDPEMPQDGMLPPSHFTRYYVVK